MANISSGNPQPRVSTFSLCGLGSMVTQSPRLTHLSRVFHVSFTCLKAKDSYLRTILSHLSGKQISAACRVAQKNGDFRLSLLLPLVTGSTAPRHLLQRQLDDWEKLKVGVVTGRDLLRLGHRVGNGVLFKTILALCQTMLGLIMCIRAKIIATKTAPKKLAIISCTFACDTSGSNLR